MAHKIYLFNSLVLEILLYACATWTLTVTMMQNIRGQYTRMVRYVRQVKVFSYETRISNDELMLGFWNIEKVIVDRRIEFAHKCLTAYQQCISDILLHEELLKGHYMTYPRMLRNCTGINDMRQLELLLRTSDGTATLRKAASDIIDTKHEREANMVRCEIQDLGTWRGAKRKAIKDLQPGSLEARHRYDNKRISQLVCRKCSQQGCQVHCQKASCTTNHQAKTLCKCTHCSRCTSYRCMEGQIKMNYDLTQVFVC